MLAIWGRWGSREETQEFVTRQLAEHPERASDILRRFVGTARTASRVFPSDFDSDAYESLKRVVDPEVVHAALRDSRPQDLEDQGYPWLFDDNMDVDARLARQFAFVHRQASSQQDDELVSSNGVLEAGSRPPARHKGWPPGFIERTAGAWQGEPPIRPNQGEFEKREPIE